jgi:hypothetical protein
MFPRLLSLRQGLAAVACMLCLAAPPAQAASLPNFVFDGQGNLLVFDAASGSGGWNGEISEFAVPALPAPLPAPLSFAVLVTFDYDVVLNRLLGSFEFTQADDLSSSIFGNVAGGFTAAGGSLVGGGQLELDYQVLGGTGRHAGLSGFGLSFLGFDPSASGTHNNYFEQGLIVAVPEPSVAGLMAFGLLALALVRTRRPARK